MSPIEFARWAKSLGFSERSGRGFEILASGIKDMGAVTKDLADSQGVAAMLAKIREASGDYGVARLAASWEQFKEKLGEKLLPTVEHLTERLQALIDRMRTFVEFHPQLTKFAVIGAAIAAAVLVIGGGLALAGAALAGFASLIPIAVALGGALWTVASALIAMNPIAWAVVAIAGFALLFYEVRKHFNELPKLWAQLKQSAYEAGTHLISSLISGIANKLHELGGAMHKVGAVVRSYLPFSPAETGPLRDLNRVRIVDTIAASIKPSQALSLAMRQLAAAIAVSAPMAFGPGVSPVLARTGGAAVSAGAGSISVTIQHLTVNASGGPQTAGDGWRKALQEEILSILRKAQAKKDRTEF